MTVLVVAGIFAWFAAFSVYALRDLDRLRRGADREDLLDELWDEAA